MDVFVARQPILTRNRSLYGYELLFRSSLANYFPLSDPDQATLQVLDNSYAVFGLDSLTDSTKAFINFTHDTLVKGYAQLLQRDAVVVEILEDVEPDAEVIDACRKLKTQGFTLALDDYARSPMQEPLIPMVDVVKVDFPCLTNEERCDIPKRMRRPGLALLAEKVETEAEFQLALRAGYDLFQGYFFAKPNVITGVKPEGMKINHLQILEEIQRPSIDVFKLEEMIKREVPLVYKVLRYINSAALGLRHPIDSLRQALLMLGEEGIRTFVSLIVLSDLNSDKPTELIKMSAARGWFCEAVGSAAGWTNLGNVLFLTGLFSLIDALLDQPIESLLDRLPLPEIAVSTLLGKPTRISPIRDLMQACEQADWPTVDRCSVELGIPPGKASELYRASLEWARAALG